MPNIYVIITIYKFGGISMGAIINNFDFTYCTNLSGVERVKICDEFDSIMRDYLWFTNDARSAIATKRIIQAIEKNPNLMYVRHKYIDYGKEKLQTLGDWCYDRYLIDVVAFILKNSKGATIPNHNGKTLGMKCANHGNGALAMCCKDNAEAMTQLSNENKDITMYAAERGLFNVVMEGIKYPGVMTRQRMGDGKTSGMICASNIPTNIPLAQVHTSLMREYFANDKARALKDCNGFTMLDILQQAYNQASEGNGVKATSQQSNQDAKIIMKMYADLLEEINESYYTSKEIAD